MKKKLALLILVLIFCGSTGCIPQKMNESMNESFASEEGKIPVASRLEDNGGLEDMGISHLIQDVLYYSISTYAEGGTYSGSSVYCRTRQGEAVRIADFSGQEMVLIYFLTDEEGNVYYLYINSADHYRVFIRKDDKEGNTVYCMEVDSQENNVDESVIQANVRSWTSLCAGAVNARGEITFQDMAGRILLFDQDGNIEGVIEPKEDRKGKTGLVNAGEAGIYSYETLEGKVILRKVNADVKKLSAPVEVKVIDERDSVQVMSGYEQGILLSAKNALWTYHPVSKELVQILSWTAPNVNLSGNYVNHVSLLDEGGFFVVAADSNTGETKRILIEEKNDDEITARTAVTIGMQKSDTFEAVAEYVADFNEKNQEFKIEIRYYQYNGQEELYKDLLKGQGPDLIDLSYVDMNILANKGVLEDLYPYLEQSEEVGTEDLISGVVTGGTINEKLVSICPSFYIWALAIPEGWSEEHGWTPERMLEMGYANPDSNVVASSDHLDFLYQYIFPVAVDGFIDWQNKECNFDSERFTGILNGIKGLDLEPNQPDSFTTSKEGFFKKEYLMCNVLIRSPEEYVDAANALEGYGELVGYPETEGKPHFLMLSNCTYGINSASGHKEGAWAFLEYLLSEEFQDSHSGIDDNFPVRRDAFEKRIYKTMGERYPQEAHKNSYLNRFTYEITERPPEITERDIEGLRFIVENGYIYKNYASGGGSFDYRNIILEEASAFFQDAKTAEETARLIQNRMSLYLKE